MEATSEVKPNSVAAFNRSSEADGPIAVITALKLRARPYPDRVFAGILFFPYSSLQEVSAGVSAMAARTADPKITMHVVNQGPGMGMPDHGARPGVGIMMYDARGEAHARSKEGFQWAFELPGVQVGPMGEMSLRQVNALAETFRDYQGSNIFWLSAPLIAGLDDETLVRAWQWYEECVRLHEGLGAGSSVVFEFMQEV